MGSAQPEDSYRTHAGRRDNGDDRIRTSEIFHCLNVRHVRENRLLYQQEKEI